MYDVYRTDSITDELRSKIPTGIYFDKCEKCGCVNWVLGNQSNKNVCFYERYNLALCDECVDGKDGRSWHRDWLWEDYGIRL